MQNFIGFVVGFVLAIVGSIEISKHFFHGSQPAEFVTGIAIILAYGAVLAVGRSARRSAGRRRLAGNEG
jgi:tellurite resistance protein TehA-like permease